MAADGTALVRGVVLARPDGAFLVPLDGAPRMRLAGATEDGARGMKLADAAAFAAFARRIRAQPKDTLWGDFMLRPEDGGWTVFGAATRPATRDEVAAAIGFDLDRGLAELDRKGVRPTMSAEELTALTRADDAGPAPPKP